MIFNHQRLISEKVGQHSSSMFIGLLHPPWFHGILKSFWSELNRTPSDSQTSFVLVYETYIAIVAGLYANLWGSRTMVCNFNYAPKWFIYIRFVPFQSGPTCPADGQKEKRKSLSHWRHRCHWAPTTSFSPPGKGGVVGCCQAPRLCFLHFFAFEPANYQGPTAQMVLARVVSQNLVPKLKTCWKAETPKCGDEECGCVWKLGIQVHSKEKLATHRIRNAPC